MKRIKLKFLDCWGGHVPEEDLYYKLLSQWYDVELSEAPDYVIDEGLGHEHTDRKYDDCVKIVSIGENLSPDFNSFDYAIGFDPLSFGDRYLRMPLYAFYAEFAKLRDRTAFQPTREELLNRDFCSFVVTNGGRGDPLRTEFFHRLSKYKKVNSGGAYLNNVGGRVKDKNAFCARHKFNIAFENSVSPGYTTEKVMQPLTVHSVPIYYGNPDVGRDFREECLVRVKNREDVERAVEEIVYLDTHDEAYLEKVTAPCLVHPVEWYEAQLESFLRTIFDPPKEAARRLVRQGMQPVYRNRLRGLYRVDDLWKWGPRLAQRLVKAMRG